MTNKYNVVTMGSRDYYQVSISLFEHDCLNLLITDFYAHKYIQKFTSKRNLSELSHEKTISLLPFFPIQKLLKIVKAPQKFQRYTVDFLFGFIAALITKLTTNRAIVYSYYIEGFVAFYKLFGLKPSNLICFQVHPSPWYINKIIDNDLIEARKIGYKKFDLDFESTYDHLSMKRYISALNFCNSIVCASSFTSRSISSGLNPNIKIGIMPYGSKLEAMVGTKKGTEKKIKLVTVCQLSQRKGIHWAFEAMKQSGVIEKFDWTIVSHTKDINIVANAPTNVKFIDKLSDVELSDLFLNSDLFVMPSLVEGFGLVYIEALSKGLPIVYTSNTGPSDFCIDGIHGFKVQPGGIDSLIHIFQKIASDDIDLSSMRRACHELAKDINWINFRESMFKFIVLNDKLVC